MAERDATTVFLEMPQAPFVWAIAVFLSASAPARVVAVLASLRDALGGANPFDSGGFGVFSETAPASAPDPGVGVADPVLAALAVAAAVVTTAGVFAVHEGVLVFSDAAQAVPGTVAVVLFALMWVLVLLLVPLDAAMGLIGLLGTALLADRVKLALLTIFPAIALWLPSTMVN